MKPGFRPVGAISGVAPGTWLYGEGGEALGVLVEIKATQRRGSHSAGELIRGLNPAKAIKPEEMARLYRQLEGKAVYVKLDALPTEVHPVEVTVSRPVVSASAANVPAAGRFEVIEGGKTIAGRPWNPLYGRDYTK